MRTNPPCYDKTTHTDCPRRYVACQSECEAYHDWLAIHEAEVKREREARESDKRVDGFLSEQNKRIRDTRRREYMREYMREYRR